eukprot:TRINITY_DN61806_c0_g1_i1.p2 TRINITY_DN61806_c0_g1~~TRINITY_DN61806_c0_g1_i1.p2  ORF type:complete len:324 (+),score=23.46 TRINITY_DN61806_c0_g1_i1:18-989(+)
MEAWLQQQLRAGSPFIESNFCEVEQTSLHYLRWRSKPEATDWSDIRGIVLLHGGGANAYWWEFLAPMLFQKEGFDILAVTNSGNGDSGHRESYSTLQWGEEVVACAKKLGLITEGRKKPFLVGHSLGGIIMTVTLSQLEGCDFAGYVSMDHIIRSWDSPSRIPATPFKSAPVKHPYSDPPVKRFVLAPSQSVVHQCLVDFIAQRSHVKEENKWYWKGDFNRRPKMLVSLSKTPPLGNMLVQINEKKCPVVFVIGEKSAIMKPNQEATQQLRAHLPVVAIPDCQHHLWLDDPVATASVLRAIFAMWEQQLSPKQENTLSLLAKL